VWTGPPAAPFPPIAPPLPLFCPLQIMKVLVEYTPVDQFLEEDRQHTKMLAVAVCPPSSATTFCPHHSPQWESWPKIYYCVSLSCLFLLSI
jgi:hypothetical protein